MGKAALFLVLAACSTSGGDATIRAVDCASVTPAAMVTTQGLAYAPSALTIHAGSAVEWTLPPQHDVSSSTPGLAVGFGKTACLVFDEPGTYDYLCSAHGFTGTVTVQ